ncbi:MAG: MoaD/ThiS family protein [Candidatus Bathyarchaeia archaeon]
MKVHVKIFGEIRQRSGMTDLWIFLPNNATVKEALAELEKKEEIKIKTDGRNIAIFLNGRRLDLIGGFNASLKEMDEIVVMPIIAGGI